MKITETPPNSDALYTAPPSDEGEDNLMKLMNALLVQDVTEFPFFSYLS